MVQRGVLEMRMRCEHLLFLHWNVPGSLLEERVPPGLQLDLHDGRTYVTMAVTSISELRAEGPSGLFACLSFAQVAVRTCVRHPVHGPGVYFLSVDAGSLLAAEGARLFPGLPCFYADANLEHHDDGSCSFRSRRAYARPSAALATVRYRPKDAIVAMAPPGSLARFLIERPVVYHERRGALQRILLEHGPHPVQRAIVAELDQTLLPVLGIQGAEQLEEAHYVRVLDVRARRPERLAAAA